MKPTIKGLARHRATAPTSQPGLSRNRAPRSPLTAQKRWLGLLVALVTAITFLPVIGNGRVDSDVTANFLDKPSDRGIGPARVRWAFSTFDLGVYQPIDWIVFGAEYEVWGLLPERVSVIEPLALAIRLAGIRAILALVALSWQLSGTWHDTDTPIARPDHAGTLSRSTSLVELGKVHERDLEFEAAELCFRNAVDRAPTRPDLANVLCGYLSQRGVASRPPRTR